MASPPPPLILYPLYFDAGRSLSSGRRTARAQSVVAPTVWMLVQALESLGLEHVVEEGARHPREPFVAGRVRVAQAEGGPRPGRKKELLGLVGAALAQSAATAPAASGPTPKTTSPGGKGEPVLVDRARPRRNKRKQ